MKIEDLNSNDLLILQSFTNTVEILKQGIATYSMTNIELTFDINKYRQGDGSVMDDLVERGVVTTLRQLIEDNPSNITFERVCNILLKFYKKLNDKEAVAIIREYKKGWKQYLDREEPVLHLAASSHIRTNRGLIKFLSYSGGIHTDIDTGVYTERENIEATERFRFLKVQLIAVATTAANLFNAFANDFPEVFNKEL